MPSFGHLRQEMDALLKQAQAEQDLRELTFDQFIAADKIRHSTAVLVFGQIKQGRGFRQVLLSGLCRCTGKWLLI